MSWGLVVGDGWFPQLDQLCRDLTGVIDREGLHNFEVLQVKEKFGGLRFYAGGANVAAREMINTAERLSIQTCECCGCPGHLLVRRVSEGRFCQNGPLAGASGGQRFSQDAFYAGKI
ncbi:MAG: hypothetical protein Q4G26_16230 [Paracoccus sp. (in: a-proteobacteria)]|nr:hypothetical protein [Paracoccus sp. (in: a-proteobacteria)]